ncbi:ankyrin repeat domain-containing protein [Wolbachia endosymbiont of Brugia pahangi]|uniref:ankyrin repeat domain-containing protein n=1 Tax=Wolbachia endosymbiont of Brugia pahangi TaxID=96495 RepID=UPI0014357416|nr:ankyrin repeat domain-containing protein [Wolbachia endosymbiont of Brugia pahangi]QIT35788.1 ankyrin repeats family protein [Wolbachia endosymbiont of Brugia pahangi]
MQIKIIKYYIVSILCLIFCHVNAVDVSGITIITDRGVSVDSASTGGHIPLHYAFHYGELEVVKFLVTNIYAERANGFKALNLAAMHVHKNVVEFFLNQELNISDYDKDD